MDMDSYLDVSVWGGWDCVLRSWAQPVRMRSAASHCRPRSGSSVLSFVTSKPIPSGVDVEMAAPLLLPSCVGFFVCEDGQV